MIKNINTYATKGSVLMDKPIDEKTNDNDFYKNAFLSMLHNDSIEKENEAAEIGLRQVWVYRCNRCNYHWLPRDIDLLDEEALFNIKPPKSCARCKSKYWNQTPQRNIQKSFEMLTLPRLRAAYRNKLREQNQ